MPLRIRPQGRCLRTGSRRTYRVAGLPRKEPVAQAAKHSRLFFQGNLRQHVVLDDWGHLFRKMKLNRHGRKPQVGDLFDRRYRLEEVLGRGATGFVYLARDLETKSRVALKMLASELRAVPVFNLRFKQEAEAAKRIKDPNVVEIFGLGETADGILYYVMEYVKGPTLRRIMEQGPMPASKAMKLLKALALALKALHAAGVVHRDFKPENVIVGRTTKLFDFSVAKLLWRTDFDLEGITAPLTNPGVLLGTRDYMSPEQWDNGEIDCRADIYSFSCVLCELIVGHESFLALLRELREAHRSQIRALLHQFVPDVPSEFSHVLASGLSKKAEDRPKSVLQFWRDLNGALQRDQTPSVMVSTPNAPDMPKTILVGITGLQVEQRISLLTVADEIRRTKKSRHLRAFAELRRGYWRGGERDLELEIKADKLILRAFPYLVLIDSVGKQVVDSLVIDSLRRTVTCEYYPAAEAGTAFVIRAAYGQPFRIQLCEKYVVGAPILSFEFFYDVAINTPHAA